MVEKIKKKFKPTKVIDAGFWEPFERAGEILEEITKDAYDLV